MFQFPVLRLTIFCVFISGCQAPNIYKTSLNNNPTSLLNDNLFIAQEAVAIESSEEIFALSDDIKQIVRNKVLSEKDFQDRSVKLIKFIFGTNSNNLAYRSNATMTAQDAYNQKTANCISLTILAYSLAELAGLDVEFQDVRVPEYWVRNGDYNMLSGHVNLKIKRPKQVSNLLLFDSRGIEIDFDPFIQKQNFPKMVVSKNIVIAMFYNNKGAMALIDKKYSEAYRYFKAAIETSPDYHASWANLGILYRFNDHNSLAEQSYRHAIALEPNSLNTLTNLSILLEMKGDFEASRKIDSAIIKHRINNPYYHALLADEAMYDGMPTKAIKHYQRAITLDDRIHEFYFGIAKAYTAAGDNEKAQRAMKKAIKANRIQSIDDKYIAKLDLLKQRD